MFSVTNINTVFETEERHSNYLVTWMEYTLVPGWFPLQWKTK